MSGKLDANQVISRLYDQESNQLRVAASVNATIAEMDVAVDAAGGDNISISNQDGSHSLLVNPDGSINARISDIALDQSTDSIAIGDGTNTINVNPDTGALLVTLDSANITTKNIFNEVNSVVSGAVSTIASFAAAANTKLLNIDVSGTNIGIYSVYIGNVLQAKKFTFYQSLNERFVFGNGLPVTAGQIIRVDVQHNRPDPGDFFANVLIEN